jgi:hypothetical protein
LVAAAPLVLAAACSPPIAEPDPTPPAAKLQWRVSDYAPEDVDPWVPLIEARGDYVIINLPHWPTYRVEGLEISDGILVVRTCIRDRVRKSDSMIRSGGPPIDTPNLVVLQVDGLKDMGVKQVQVLNEAGRAIAPVYGLRAAVAIAKDYASTDFEFPLQWYSVTFDLTHGGERLVYWLDYSECQTIDRAGSNAVSGTFVVDAVTGEVVDASLEKVPLENTRQLVAGSRLLDWSASGHVLTVNGSSLMAYDVQGQLVRSVTTKVDLSAFEFLTLEGESAWFKGPQGCLAVDVSTGATRTGDCPEIVQPPGTRTQVYTEKTATITIEVDLGTVSVIVTTSEDPVEDRAQLSASVTRGTIETAVETSAMEGHTVLYNWAVDAGSQIIYFSTGEGGPSYGNWVTRRSLGALDLQAATMRRVAIMPRPDFRVSPCGRYAVYGTADRVFIVNLTGPG